MGKLGATKPNQPQTEIPVLLVVYYFYKAFIDIAILKQRYNVWITVLCRCEGVSNTA